jgi:hypothetical protein
MKFHSDLFGWQYVWRNFAEEKGGRVVTETADEESPVVSMTVPVEGTGVNVLFIPETKHGKKGASASAIVCFPPAGDFVFAIFEEKLTHQLGKALGMQDLQVQDHLFDGKFMIQGNNAVKVQELFLEPQLREQILLQPPHLLHIDKEPAKHYSKHGIPAGLHAVVYQFDGSMDKLLHLQAAHDIVSSVLKQLANIGVISGVAAQQVADDSSPADSESTGQRRLRSPLLDR